MESRRNLAEVVDQVTAFAPDALRVRAELVQPRLSLVAQVRDLFLCEPQLLCGLCPRTRDDPLRLGPCLLDVLVRLGFAPSAAVLALTTMSAASALASAVISSASRCAAARISSPSS